MEAKIRYARTADGVDIAYAVHGSGPPLLVARPVLRAAVDGELGWMDPTLPRLAERRSVIIWDWRSLGLSSTARAEFTLESTVHDMEAVAEAIGAPSFDLLASVTPSHSALAFAARRPDRVRRLVLWNPSPAGLSPRTTTLAHLPDIVTTHFRQYIQLAALSIFSWDQADLARRWERDMTAQFTADDWLRLMDQMEHVDGMNEAAAVQAPTLVILHLRAVDGRVVAGPEWQTFVRSLAAVIPNAELAVIKPDSARTFVELVEEFLSDDDVPTVDAPHGTAIILFADIADSTALTERLGDAAFRAKARDLDDALRTIIRDCGGAVIDAKTLGDGVLATFPAASQAIDAALRCGGAGDAQGLQLHLGLHAGDVIREQNNVFGGAVNIAARISSLSAPGEVLVSDIVRGLARTSAGVTFEDRGEQALKGVGEPVRVFAVRRSEG